MAILASSQYGVHRASISFKLVHKFTEGLIGRLTVDWAQVLVIKKGFLMVWDSVGINH